MSESKPLSPNSAPYTDAELECLRENEAHDDRCSLNALGIRRVLATIDALRARVDELTRERDEAIGTHAACVPRSWYLDVADALLRESTGPHELVAEARRLRAYEARVKSLEAALTVFVKNGELDNYTDEFAREVRAALSESAPSGEVTP